MALVLTPVSVQDARAFVDRHHRHHKAPQGGLFAVGVAERGDLVGVAIVGRPVARALQDGWTAEVVRLCTLEVARNAASKLYAACWRAARALGYRRLGTYTLKSELGTSLKAAEWVCLYETRDRPGGWNVPSRPRVVQAPTEGKRFWAPNEVWGQYRIPEGAAVSLNNRFLNKEGDDIADQRTDA